MKLTEKQANQNDFSIHAYINDKGEGFVLGGDAMQIPSDFKEEYYNNKLKVLPVNDGSFDRVIDRTNIAELKSMKPAFARITDANSLIIE